MISFVLVLVGIYSLIIILLNIGFLVLPKTKITGKNPTTTFSVIIPFRNEADNLPILLKSISKLNYPKNLFEIILINDNSIDAFEPIIETCINKYDINLRLLHNSIKAKSPKKEAIHKGITNADNKWIITTDADCVFNSNWLLSYDNFISNHATDFIAGPVNYNGSFSFLGAFQLLDFSSLIGVTIGAFGLKQPIICNGANVAYKKTTFIELNGFIGNENSSSGDDVFLLEKATNNKNINTSYLFDDECIVSTTPVSSLKALINQRVRWAAKTSKLKNPKTKILGMVVLLTNLIFCLSPIAVLFNYFHIEWLVSIWFSKIAVDFMLIFQTLNFFKQLKYIIFYPFAAIIYPYFNVFIGLRSVFGTFSWKNRTYKS